MFFSLMSHERASELNEYERTHERCLIITNKYQHIT